MDGSNGKTTRRKGNNGNGFKPGKSGNPNGRPKMTQEQRDALTAVRNLAPYAAQVLSDMMHNPDTPPAVRLKIVEIVFDRTFGKPEMQVMLEDPKNDALSDIRAEVTRIKAAIADD